jgi:hypothetical protein
LLARLILLTNPYVCGRKIVPSINRRRVHSERLLEVVDRRLEPVFLEEDAPEIAVSLRAARPQGDSLLVRGFRLIHRPDFLKCHTKIEMRRLILRIAPDDLLIGDDHAQPFLAPMTENVNVRREILIERIEFSGAEKCGHRLVIPALVKQGLP